MKANARPGSQRHNQFDFVTEYEDGSKVGIHIRNRNATPPEGYHTKATHRTNKNLVLYFTYLSIILCVLGCGVLRIVHACGGL